MASSQIKGTNGKRTGIPSGGFTQGLKCRKGPFIIGVAGGTASGKSSVCKKIIEEIEADAKTRSKNVICVSQDLFYRELTGDELRLAENGNFNFDHPNAFDFELMIEILKQIIHRKVAKLPKYDYRTNARIAGEFTEIQPVDVVLFEGILTFYWPELRDMFDMKLFVDTDADTRLARRVTRDIEERGRTLDTVLYQYINSVKPAFEEFCLPTKKFADIIIPRGADNVVAIDLIVQSLKDILASDSKTPSIDEGGLNSEGSVFSKSSSDSKNARLH